MEWRGTIAWDQARNGVRDPHRFHRYSDCSLRINVGPTVATQLFEMCNIASGRRIGTDQWSADSHHPERREFRVAINRNIDRARARLALEHARLLAGADEDIRDGKEKTARNPADDELAPRISKESRATRSPFLVLDPTWTTGKAGIMEGTCPNPNTPQRDGEPLGRPATQQKANWGIRHLVRGNLSDCRMRNLWSRTL